jgi:hypothetical protein
MGKVNWYSITTFDNWTILPDWSRGKITGKGPAAKSNIGRKPTNRQYAEQHGITRRQASKRRR